MSGDFCQLPPVAGVPLYSIDVSRVMRARLTDYEQKKIMGKALWHQFTVVIILRKNMRQSDSSKENDRFRGCLRRMRYGKCNKDDLIWLESQVAGKYNSQLDLSQPQWRYTSVINGHNSQRDKLNEMAAM